MVETNRIVDLTIRLEPHVNPSTNRPFSHVEPVEDRTELSSLVKVNIGHCGKDLAILKTDVTFSNRPPCTYQRTFYLNREFFLGALLPQYACLNKDVSDMPPTQTVGDAAIVDLSHVDRHRKIELADVKRAGGLLRKGDIAIIKTGYLDEVASEGTYAEKRKELMADSPRFTSDALQYLIDRDIKMLGYDLPTIGGESFHEENDLYKRLHLNGVALVENLCNIDQVTSERAFIIALSMKARGMSGAPTRVVAIEQDKIIDLTLKPRLFPDPQVDRFAEAARHVEPLTLLNYLYRFYTIDNFELRSSNARLNVVDEFGQWATINDQYGTHIERPGRLHVRSFTDVFERYQSQGFSQDILQDITNVPLNKVTGEAAIVDLTYIGAGQRITVSDLEMRGGHIQEGDIVLVKTGYTDRYYWRTERYYDSTPGFSNEAMEWLTDQKIRTLGVDAPSIETQSPSQGVSIEEATHLVAWKAEIEIVEDLCNLDAISGNRAFVALLPVLALAPSETASVRAVAIEKQSR